MVCRSRRCGLRRSARPTGPGRGRRPGPIRGRFLPAGANGLPAPARMSCSTRRLGSLTIRSPERWSQEAKNAPETRRQGKPIMVPVATSLWARAAALASQKKSAGRSVMPAFLRGAFSGGVRPGLQQVAGGGQPARPRRSGAIDDHLAAGAAVVPAGLAGGPAVKERRAGAHDDLSAGCGRRVLAVAGPR